MNTTTTKQNSNPNVGDEIKVVVQNYPEKVFKNLKVVRKGPMSIAAFNFWDVKDGKKIVRVSWNPMVEYFVPRENGS